VERKCLHLVSPELCQEDKSSFQAFMQGTQDIETAVEICLFVVHSAEMKILKSESIEDGMLQPGCQSAL
jgi:hypothetical protein